MIYAMMDQKTLFFSPTLPLQLWFKALAPACIMISALIGEEQKSQ